MAKHKRFAASLKRKAAFRSAKKKFILVCEGAKTEPQYFRELKKTLKASLIELKIIGGAGTPEVIAKKAVGLSTALKKEARDSFEKRDEVWAVFDRDEHQNFHEAIDLCTRKAVPVARSNPCFEIWLLLHLEDYNKACNRKDCQVRLSKIYSHYCSKKHTLTDVKQLIGEIEIAERRAERQLKCRSEEGVDYGPPSTTVFKLTRRIRENE